MRIPGPARAAARMLLPVDMPLPKRYWRWTWLALVVRLAVGVPFFIVAIGPYLLCKGFCMIMDRAGGLMGGIPVHCYNKDLEASGWREVPRRAPAVQLSPEWAERIRPRHGT